MISETIKQRLATIEQLPSPLNTMLKDLPIEQLGYFSSTQVDDMCQAMTISRAELGLVLLPLASSFAVAPVSNFHVGAVAFDSAGNAYLGANFEFAGNHIGQTIHAEQSAIAHMWQRGATELALLVINYAPCGHCRQFINEVNIADKILRQADDENSHCQQDSVDTVDMAHAQAIHAHDHCHAPYSGNKCGIALEYAIEDTEKEDNTEIVTGRYAENAAYNPSLPALQVALNFRRMQGKDWQNIKRVVMVETTTNFSQVENTRSLLASINQSTNQDIPIEWYKGSANQSYLYNLQTHAIISVKTKHT
ncbi:MAG: cytidine deaminase [Pseudomonadales bacterium]|nr:MAG: cytidine deaminase [Pseudomonadales bacterium]